jgi:hypothetical protein
MPKGEPIPIACELPADAIPDRVEEWRALREQALVEAAPIPGGARMTFRPEHGAAVRALVDAEAQCCRFLSFAVADHDGAVVVDCTAPDGAEVVPHALAGLA